MGSVWRDGWRVMRQNCLTLSKSWTVIIDDCHIDFCYVLGCTHVFVLSGTCRDVVSAYVSCSMSLMMHCEGSTWKLTTPNDRHLQKVITYPVLERALSHNSEYSLCHQWAKSALTNIMREISAVGWTIRPWHWVFHRCHAMGLMANWSIAFGLEQ